MQLALSKTVAQIYSGKERQGRRRAIARGQRPMTSEQSKLLKVGTRVCFNGEEGDHGTVKATNWK
jgi:hypothetical protein